MCLLVIGNADKFKVVLQLLSEILTYSRIRNQRNFQLRLQLRFTAPELCLVKSTWRSQIINNSSSLNKGNHDRDGVWISDLN